MREAKQWRYIKIKKKITKGFPAKKVLEKQTQKNKIHHFIFLFKQILIFDFAFVLCRHYKIPHTNYLQNSIENNLYGKMLNFTRNQVILKGQSCCGLYNSYRMKFFTWHTEPRQCRYTKRKIIFFKNPPKTFLKIRTSKKKILPKMFFKQNCFFSDFAFVLRRYDKMPHKHYLQSAIE